MESTSFPVLVVSTFILIIGRSVHGVDFNFNVQGVKGVITSPNYPNHYPLNISCTWTLRSLPGRYIKIQFIDFRLERVKRCIYDYVQIRQDSSTPWRDLPRFCGIHPPQIYRSEREFLQIRFRSDHLNGVDIGFKLRWETEVLSPEPEPQALSSRSDKVILISFSSVLAVFIAINLILIFFLWRRSRELDDLRRTPKSASAEFTWIPYGKSMVHTGEKGENKSLFKQVPMGTATKLLEENSSCNGLDKNIDRVRSERPTSYFNQLSTLDRPARYDSLPSSVITGPASTASEAKDNTEMTAGESCENTTNLYISSDVSMNESDHEKLHLNTNFELAPALTLV